MVSSDENGVGGLRGLCRRGWMQCVGLEGLCRGVDILYPQGSCIDFTQQRKKYANTFIVRPRLSEQLGALSDWCVWIVDHANY